MLRLAISLEVKGHSRRIIYQKAYVVIQKCETHYSHTFSIKVYLLRSWFNYNKKNIEFEIGRYTYGFYRLDQLGLKMSKH